MRFTRIFWPGLITIFIFLSACNQDTQKTNNPNILFILIDDMGYKDLSCYGSEFYETPHIDQLARQGARFTNAYAASAVCSPTRAAILTGKNPARLGITDWTGPEEWHPEGPLQSPEIKENLPHEEYTLAEALKDQGYATCFLGKWHIGDGEYLPPNHGFDVSIGAIDAGAPPSYFYPYYRGNWKGTGWPTQIDDLVPGGEEGEYLTDRLTTEAIDFIDSIGDRPFLLYLSHYAVHTPLEAKSDLIEKYQKKAEALYKNDTVAMVRERNDSYTRIIQNHAIYGAMVESVDHSVGRLVATLKEKGITDNTIIIFTSDNGGYTTSAFPLPGQTVDIDKLPTAVLPYRAGKGWYYEGGVKIPTIISWPGVTEANSLIDDPVVSTDFYPTILEMIETDLLPQQHQDGMSIVPLLTGAEDKLEREAIYWHYPHYHNSGQTPATAMRRGKYKFIHEYDGDRMLLYDLEKDIHEDNNLVEEMPELREELLNQLNEWKKNVNAALPGQP